jgi:predicted Zn-dependent protease
MLALTLTTGLLLAQKPKNIKPGWNLFSVEQDVQLGKEAAAEIEKQVQVIDNRALTDYVNRMAQKLVATPEAGKFAYTFKVVNDPSINAFALPGGPAYLHTGLIAAADNEAQVAGVLAHEIAHVALRHGTAQVTKGQALQLIAGLGGAMLGGGGSMLGQLAQLGVGLGANSLLMKFSRGAESDADLLGARMMAKAGYDPVEMARFFQKLEEQERASGRSMPQFLSDHPSPGNRVKAVSQEVKMMPARQYATGNNGELQQMKSIIKGLPAPPKKTDFRSSGKPEAARPATQFKQHASSGISFDYPNNWEVFQSQGASEITVASREGILETNGNAEIGYGAIIGLSQNKPTGNLQRDSEAFLQQLMQSNREMQRSNQKTQTANVAGSTALLNIFYNKSPYANQREVDAILTIQHPQGLAYMILISPESEYARAQPAFEQMIKSLRFSR